MFCLHKSTQLLVRRKEDYIIICKLFAEQKKNQCRKLRRACSSAGDCNFKTEQTAISGRRILQLLGESPTGAVKSTRPTQ